MTKEDIVFNLYKDSYIGKDRRYYWDKDKKTVKIFSHLVWNLYHPDDLIVKNSGYAIHHKDGNKLNDHPYNLEKILIRKHSYNHNIGRKRPEEEKRRISETMKNKKINVGESNPMYGKVFSEEHRKNLSIAKIGNTNCLGHKQSEEAKRKKSLALKGRKANEKTKQLLSELNKGENNPMYGRTGINSPRFGKVRTLEEKKRISEALKTYYQNKKLSKV